MARNQWPRYSYQYLGNSYSLYEPTVYCGTREPQKQKWTTVGPVVQRAMGKRKRGGGFEVVPVGFSRGGGEYGGAKSSGKSNLNTLRQAHSSAMRKKEESMHALPECMSCGKLPHALSSGPCLHHVHVSW